MAVKKCKRRCKFGKLRVPRGQRCCKKRRYKSEWERL